MLLAGVGFGPFRNPPRQAYASLEVDHVFTTYPAGCWVSADLAPEGRFLGAGLLLTLPMGEHWRVLAGSGPGWFVGTSGLDLGKELEFRSSLTVLRRFKGGGGLGLSLSHYSNGGLSRHNPGAETLRAFWAMPLPF